MQSWEYVIIAVGAASIALALYLILMLKKLSKTLDDLDALVVKNTKDITSLIENVESISSSAKGAVTTLGDKVSSALTAVNALNAGSGMDLSQGIKSVIGAAGFVFSAYKLIKGYSDQKKIKKIIKNAEKVSKK